MRVESAYLDGSWDVFAVWVTIMGYLCWGVKMGNGWTACQFCYWDSRQKSQCLAHDLSNCRIMYNSD